MSKYQAKTIPTPGSPPNIQTDAKRVFDVLRSGGLVILPTEVGYGLMASSADAVDRAFAAKKRPASHSQGIIASYDLHRSLHMLDEGRFAMTKALVRDLDMGLGIIAPYKKDHPLLQTLSPETLHKIDKNGTLAMYVGGGSLLEEVCRLNDEEKQITVGSSANVTGSGQKFRVDDIEDEVKETVDLIVDYGLQRYHNYGRASVFFDFGEMKVVRMGSCYELFRERMRKFWGVELPEDPEYKTDR